MSESKTKVYIQTILIVTLLVALFLLIIKLFSLNDDYLKLSIECNNTIYVDYGIANIDGKTKILVYTDNWGAKLFDLKDCE